MGHALQARLEKRKNLPVVVIDKEDAILDKSSFHLVNVLYEKRM